MRHLTQISDVSNRDVERIFAHAREFEAVLDRRIKKVPALAGRTIGFLFIEPSTRTRVSFELAARRLSADTVSLAASSSSLKKGETLTETAYTLAAMNVDCVVIRHQLEGAATKLAQLDLFHVINGGDGAHEHPTQALLDAYCALKRLGSLEGKRVVIVGDIVHSRVARSGMQLWKRLGAEVIAIAPASMLPPHLPDGVSLAPEIDDAIAEADILYFLRIQRERLTEPCFPSVEEYRRYYALTRERLERIPERTVIMHPGPVNVGVELDYEAVHHSQSLVNDQVRCGVAVRMAILADFIAGEGGSLEIPA